VTARTSTRALAKVGTSGSAGFSLRADSRGFDGASVQPALRVGRAPSSDAPASLCWGAAT
jgi:hypothetical protein